MKFLIAEAKVMRRKVMAKAQLKDTVVSLFSSEGLATTEKCLDRFISTQVPYGIAFYANLFADLVVTLRLHSPQIYTDDW